MTALPSQLSYAATPADSTAMVAAEVRNPLASILTTVNSLITTLGSGVAGQVASMSPSAITPAYPPGYELAYAEFTSPVTVSSATEASGTAVVDSGSVTYDGTAVIVEFFAPTITPAATDFIVVTLFDSATEVGRIASATNANAAAVNFGGTFRRKLTPSAGSHDYKVTAFRNAVNGTITAGVGGTGAYLPGYIRITKA